MLGLEKDVQPSVLAEKLGSLSPLVANNVIGNLTTDEKRSIIGLPSVEGGGEIDKVQTPESFKFSWEDEISVFSEFGEDASNYEELAKRSVTLFEDVEAFEFQLDMDEAELMQENFAKIEANTPEENKVLEYVKKFPLSTKTEIAKATDLTLAQVDNTINKLKEDSVLSLVEGAWSINDKRPSKALVNRIADEIKKIEVKYKYTGPKDSKNREFCAALLQLNRLYTRKEIDTISKRVDRNVWTKRGGWQTVKGTDIHLPFCRHTWSSILTKKK